MKKIYIKLLLIILFIAGIIYWLGTRNFYLGSNSKFFNTAFDVEHANWRCKEYDLYASLENQTTVSTIQKYMSVVDKYENKVFYIFPRGDRLVDLYYANEELDRDESKFICTAQVVYKKRFGRIYRFEILNTSKSIVDFGSKLIFVNER